MGSSAIPLSRSRSTSAVAEDGGGLPLSLQRKQRQRRPPVTWSADPDAEGPVPVIKRPKTEPSDGNGHLGAGGGVSGLGSAAAAYMGPATTSGIPYGTLFFRVQGRSGTPGLMLTFDGCFSRPVVYRESVEGGEPQRLEVEEVEEEGPPEEYTCLGFARHEVPGIGSAGMCAATLAEVESHFRAVLNPASPSYCRAMGPVVYVTITCDKSKGWMSYEIDPTGNVVPKVVYEGDRGTMLSTTPAQFEAQVAQSSAKKWRHSFKAAGGFLKMGPRQGGVMPPATVLDVLTCIKDLLGVSPAIALPADKPLTQQQRRAAAAAAAAAAAGCRGSSHAAAASSGRRQEREREAAEAGVAGRSNVLLEAVEEMEGDLVQEQSRQAGLSLISTLGLAGRGLGHTGPTRGSSHARGPAGLHGQAGMNGHGHAVHANGHGGKAHGKGSASGGAHGKGALGVRVGPGGGVPDRTRSGMKQVGSYGARVTGNGACSPSGANGLPGRMHGDSPTTTHITAAATPETLCGAGGGATGSDGCVGAPGQPGHDSALHSAAALASLANQLALPLVPDVSALGLAGPGLTAAEAQAIQLVCTSVKGAELTSAVKGIMDSLALRASSLAATSLALPPGAAGAAGAAGALMAMVGLPQSGYGGAAGGGGAVAAALGPLICGGASSADVSALLGLAMGGSGPAGACGAGAGAGGSGELAAAAADGSLPIALLEGSDGGASAAEGPAHMAAEAGAAAEPQLGEEGVKAAGEAPRSPSSEGALGAEGVPSAAAPASPATAAAALASTDGTASAAGSEGQPGERREQAAGAGPEARAGGPAEVADPAAVPALVGVAAPGATEGA